MNSKRKEMTEEEKKIIIKLHNQCKSLRQIAEIVGRPKSTIQSAVDRFSERKTIKNKNRSGRPRILNEHNIRMITRKVKENPKTSAPKIANEMGDLGINLSASTVRNVLRNNNYHGRVARRKYFINEVNRKKRLEFAKTYENKPPEFWKKVIFTDESKFNIFNSDGRVMVWRKKNCELQKENLCPTVKHGGGSVLVWGCMSAFGVGNLVFIDGIMDHKTYINILKENLAPSAMKMGLQNDYIFMQDNDPKHTALNTRLWLLYNTPHRLITPPQSPDINPIEHLWDIIDKNARKKNITSKETLRQSLQEAWKEISQSTTYNLVESMPRRLKAIIKSKGYPTKY